MLNNGWANGDDREEGENSMENSRDDDHWEANNNLQVKIASELPRLPLTHV